MPLLKSMKTRSLGTHCRLGQHVMRSPECSCLQGLLATAAAKGWTAKRGKTIHRAIFWACSPQFSVSQLNWTNLIFQWVEAGQVGLSGVSVVQSAVRDTKEGIEDVTIPLQDGEVPCVRDLTSNEQSVPPFVQVCILWIGWLSSALLCTYRFFQMEWHQIQSQYKTKKKVKNEKSCSLAK